jgi:quinol monooxygenase YgiN
VAGDALIPALAKRSAMRDKARGTPLGRRKVENSQGGNMIRVVAIITAKPGMRGEVLAAFNANRPAVLAEKGCREYGATVDNPDAAAAFARFGADTVVIIETWDTMEDLAAHGASAHMKEYGRKTREFVETRAVHILNPA